SVVFLYFNDHSNIPVTQWVNLSRFCSNDKITLPKKVLEVTCSNFPYREYSHGTMVNDVNSDNNVAITTVIQNCVIILETKPVLMAIGRNTTIITKVMAVTVNPISEAPS